MGNDPLKIGRTANIGAAGMARGRDDNRWETATVVTYNSGTHTAVVRTDSGRSLQNVPQMRPTFGSFEHLQTGTTVVVSWDLGMPVIIGVIDFLGATQTAIPSPTLTGVDTTGANDPTQPADGINNYRPPHAPTDMTGGDWAHVGTLGNHVAVLEGGVSLLGSPTAHVQSFGPSGTLRTVSRRQEGFTDFGNWRMENLQGRTSFILRAGSNQTTQTGLDEEHWTIRLDLGATGDMLDFNITEPEGRLLFRLHAGSDGRVQIYGDGGVDMSSGAGGDATLRHDVQGDRITNLTGDDTHAVQGDSNVSVDGDETHVVGGDSSRVVTGGVTKFVGGDAAHGTGGDATHVVGGGLTGTVAKDTSLTGGGKLSAALLNDVTVTTPTNVTVTAGATSKVDGTSVVLGATGLHPLPLFDVFLLDLSQFLLVTLPAVIASLTPNNPYSLGPALQQVQEYGAKVASMAPYVSRKVRND